MLYDHNRLWKKAGLADLVWQGYMDAFQMNPVLLSIVCNPSPSVPTQKLPLLSSKMALTLLLIRL